jgi:hypothetical protein
LRKPKAAAELAARCRAALFEQYIRSDFLAAFSVSLLLVVRGDTDNDCL